MSKPPAREPPKPTPTISTAKSTPTIAGTATTKVTPSLPARGRAAAAAAAAPVPPEPAAPNEPPDIDDLDAMVSSLDQFASGVDDDKIDILSKDDPPPPRGNNTWVAANQSKPIASKPRSSAISHGSAGSPASPSLARTSRVASNLANSSSNNNAPPSSTPPTSAPAPPPVTRSASQQDATASQQQKQNTLVKLSSKIFQNRASSGQAPTPVAGASSSSATNAGSSAPASGGASGDNVSPRLLSPRAPADTSAARPLAVIGKPEPDETLLATADRYRKMSCAISDLTKKQHQQMQNVDQHAQLVAKVLQKAEKQSLTPAPISSQTAAMVQRLSTLSVVTAESTARAYDGMGKTVDTIDSVRASLRQQHVEREQFDAKVAKFLKDKEKSKKANELPEVERALKAERERLDEQFVACDATLREVYDRKEDITAGFLTQMLESMLAQARAQAALIPELERLTQAARGSMASGDERRRMTGVYQEADDALAAAGSASGVTDQQTVQIADARGTLIRDRGARVAALARNAAAGKPAAAEPAAQQALVHVLVGHDLAALNAMCVAGRASESALLEHVCNALDGHGLLLATIEQGVSKVVAASEHEQTLFRSNTETTKLIGAFTKLHGLAYLQQLLQPVIERLKQANEDYEINPTGGAALSDDAVAANAARLRALTTQFFAALTASSELVPPPLRAIAAHLHKEVAKKYPDAARSAVGGYICLRFVCPAMMTPRAFGVVTVDPPARAARALTLVSKIVQNVANGLEFKKEAFMMPFNDFVLANQASMNAFIDKVIAVPKAKVDATAPLATKEQALQRDIPALHYFMANNVGKMAKTMCDYKHYDAIAPFCAAVADAGSAPTAKPATLA